MPGCPHLRGPRAPRLRGDGEGLRRRHPPPQLLAYNESTARALSDATHARCSYGYYRGASGQPRQYARASAKDLAAAATTTSTFVSEAHSLDQAAKSTSGSLQLGRIEESQLIRHRGARSITCHD